ncbi:MAG: DNA translocase FtsK [Anaerolineales bacterium]|nr:DNA translocase FtsK [Anaerolineales bacterium]
MGSGAITREYLNFQSDRIERVLAAHKVPVRVDGGSVTPRWIRFHVAPGLGAKVASIRNLSEELALALGAPDVRVSRDGEQLAVEVPRPDAAPVLLLPLLRRMSARPPYTACLGLADDGRPLLIRLPSPEVAHILVAGATGSGKTELMRAIVTSLALQHRQAQLQIVLIDPKQRGFGPLAKLQHLLAPIATGPAEALAVLERCVAEMERRDQEDRCTPRILIAVDELGDLLATGGKAVEAALTRLAQRGREAGLHLVAGTQKPSSAALGSMLKANFPVRLVGRVGSAEDARVASGQAGTGAEKLLGRGDFLVVAGGHTTRFQAAWVPRGDWEALAHLMVAARG